jgi:hypothetical protein
MLQLPFEQNPSCKLANTVAADEAALHPVSIQKSRARLRS